MDAARLCKGSLESHFMSDFHSELLRVHYLPFTFLCVLQVPTYRKKHLLGPGKGAGLGDTVCRSLKKARPENSQRKSPRSGLRCGQRRAGREIGLELYGRQVAQDRVQAFAVVDLLQKCTNRSTRPPPEHGIRLLFVSAQGTSALLFFYATTKTGLKCFCRSEENGRCA